MEHHDRVSRVRGIAGWEGWLCSRGSWVDGVGVVGSVS